MIVGTWIFKGSGNTQYSPEFPRGSLAAVFSADVLNLIGSPTLTILVEHRNAEDTGFTTAGTFSSITATGTATLDVTAGLKEIIRFAYGFDAGDQAEDGVQLYMAPPSWRPYP